MNADAFSVGYVADERQAFLELRRVGDAERIGSFGNEEVSVLECFNRDVSVLVERQ